MSANRGGGNRGGRGRGQPRGGGGGGGGPSGPPRGGGPTGSYGGGGRGGGAGPPGAGASGDDVFGGPPSVDQRLAPTNLNALVQTLKSIPYDPARPTRPSFGTVGKAGVLRANFFPVKFPKKGIIYDYHVEISPKTDLKSIRSRLFTLLEQSAQPGWQEYVPFIAHDGGGRLVSSKKLPQPLDVSILFLREGQQQATERDKTYTLSIAFIRELEASQLDS